MGTVAGLFSVWGMYRLMLLCIWFQKTNGKWLCFSRNSLQIKPKVTEISGCLFKWTIAWHKGSRPLISSKNLLLPHFFPSKKIRQKARRKWPLFPYFKNSENFWKSEGITVHICLPDAQVRAAYSPNSNFRVIRKWGHICLTFEISGTALSSQCVVLWK